MSGAIRDAIAAALAESGLSQRELARRAGTTHSQLSEYLSGKRDPNVSTVEAWMQQLDLDITPRSSSSA